MSHSAMFVSIDSNDEHLHIVQPIKHAIPSGVFEYDPKQGTSTTHRIQCFQIGRTVQELLSNVSTQLGAPNKSYTLHFPGTVQRELLASYQSMQRLVGPRFVANLVGKIFLRTVEIRKTLSRHGSMQWKAPKQGPLPTG
eukprot:jgi/Psemu1/303840/fgenesh1_kg.125_\